MVYPECLDSLINNFKKLPGIGDKNGERLALAVIEGNAEEIENFSENLLRCQKLLKRCQICGQISDNDICSICSDNSRNKNIICVLEDYKSVFAFEKVGNYNGTYHVLGGLISPIEGIGPEDINIESLIKRCKELDNCEVILALKSSIEGETTTMYLSKILNNENITISRLSYGIPMGAEIDYMDGMTLDRALADRKNIS